jgi:hypothetical protein
MLDTTVLTTRRFFFAFAAALVAGVARSCARLFLNNEVNGLHMALRNLLPCGSACKETSLLLALAAGEDHRFFSHQGIDPVAVFRALAQTAMGHLQGASSVEQQLVRTINGDYRICISRKLTEMMLASTVCEVFTKVEVAQAYLSIAYFGTGIIGLAAAIEQIRPPATKDGLSTAAALVAHLKYPLPKSLPDKLAQRRGVRTAHIKYRMQNLKHWLPKTSPTVDHLREGEDRGEGRQADRAVLAVGPSQRLNIGRSIGR